MKGVKMILYRKDITNKIAEKTGLYKKDIKEMLNAFREIVYEELQEDNTIFIRNLFKIQPVTMNSRLTFVPSTKERRYIEERKTVKMIPSEKLKQIIRGENDDTDDDELIAIEKEIAKLQALQEKLKNRSE